MTTMKRNIEKVGVEMFGKSLNYLMREKHITNKKMSEMLWEKYEYKISQESIAKYRTSDRQPPPKVIKYLSSILACSTDYLLNNDIVAVNTVPKIGVAKCNGKLKPMTVSGTAHYSGNDYNVDMYALVVNGMGMSPELETGDELIVDPRKEAVSGDLVHYRLRGESAVKVMYLDPDANLVQFIPYNLTSGFKIMTIRMDDELYDDLEVAPIVAINKIALKNRTSRLNLIGRA